MDYKLFILCLLTTSSLNNLIFCMDSTPTGQRVLDQLMAEAYGREQGKREERERFRRIDPEAAEYLDLNDEKWDEIDESCAECCVPSCTLLSCVSAALCGLFSVGSFSGYSSTTPHGVIAGGIAATTGIGACYLRDKLNRQPFIKARLRQLAERRGFGLKEKTA